MNDPSGDDPLKWDTTKLIQELCNQSSNSPFAKHPPSKIPNLERLAAALLEHDIDGDTLLKWEDEMGSVDGLFIDLGLTKASQKLTFSRVIKVLQQKSYAYNHPTADEDVEDHNSLDVNIPADVKAEDGEDVTMEGSSDQILPSIELPLPPLDPVAPVVLETGQTVPKKRRIAPTNISASKRATVRYLGGSNPDLSGLDLKASLKACRASNLGDHADDHGMWVVTQKQPVGRQFQVFHAIRRHLRNNSRIEQGLKSGMATLTEASGSEEEEDKILPCYGDSEDEGYDSETLREIEEEKHERRQSTKFLNKEETSRILDEMVASFESEWRAKKLPRCEKDASRYWRQARRNGRFQELAKLTKKRADLNARIEGLRHRIMQQDWKKANEVRNQARILDVSVEQHLRTSWQIETLKGKEPARPPPSSKQPRPRSQKSSRVTTLSDDDGELIRGSDSEVSADDFIVNDDEVEPGDLMDIDQSVLHGDCSNHNRGHASQMEAFSERSLSPALPIRSKTNTPGVSTGSLDHPIIDLTSDNENNASAVPPHDKVNVAKPRRSASHSQPQSSLNLEVPASSSKVTGNFRPDIPFSRPEEIAAIPLKKWENLKDHYRLTIGFLWSNDQEWREYALWMLRHLPADSVWAGVIEVLPDSMNDIDNLSEDITRESIHAIIGRLFWQYTLCTVPKGPFPEIEIERVAEERSSQFHEFVQFIRDSVKPYFPPWSGDIPDYLLTVREYQDLDNVTEDEALDQVITGRRPSKRRAEDKSAPRTAAATAAENMRLENEQRTVTEQARRNAFDERRNAGRSKVTDEMARLIVNPSKEGDDDDGFIYVAKEIAGRIKDHQIEGVQFMWNHILANSGCLLAHTMGLGKTMQVITVLVAIAEAGASPMEATKKQIPPELREPANLIVCDSGLVENWMEEITSWAPKAVFNKDANCFQVASNVSVPQRDSLIRQWDRQGGIMIIGYTMFIKLFDKEDLRHILLQRPSIVIADEAHRAKNPASKITQAMAKFATKRRIALTGTPMANNLMEYYSMIEWVCPNYLGPRDEFKAEYEDPVRLGLWGDSTPMDTRRAKKMLAALEKTVEPKTHRLTLNSLKAGDLPTKKEFILTLPLTDLQAQLYDRYAKALGSTAHHFIAVRDNLGLIYNHPEIFLEKLLYEAQKRGLNTPRASRITNKLDMTPDESIPAHFLKQALKLLAKERNVGSMNLSWRTRHLVAILDKCRELKQKVLVFSMSKVTLHFLHRVLTDQGRRLSILTGDTPVAQRLNLIHNVNATQSDVEVFLISTKAGGVGLNIVGANRVVIFDFKFNPVDEQQAIARAYRLGQKLDVFVYRFVSGGTDEGRIHAKSIFKTQLSSRVVDRENPKRFGEMNKSTSVTLYESPEHTPLEEFQGKDLVLDVLLSKPEHRDAIRSIIISDTFREEDPNEEPLSDRENQEIQYIYKMNQVRNIDQVEFQRLGAELSRLRGANQSRALQNPSAQSVTSAGFQGPRPTTMAPYKASQALPPAAPAGGAMPQPPPYSSQGAQPLNSVPLSAMGPQTGTPAPVPQMPHPPMRLGGSGAPMFRHPQGIAPQVAPMGYQGPAAPPFGHTQNPALTNSTSSFHAAAPAPMSMSNAGSGPGMTNAPQSGLSAPPGAASQQPNGRTVGGESTENWDRIFEEHLVQYCPSDSPHRIPYSRWLKTLMHRIRQRRQNFGDLPNRAHYKILYNLARLSRSFCELIITDKIKDDKLADGELMRDLGSMIARFTEQKKGITKDDILNFPNRDGQSSDKLSRQNDADGVGIKASSDHHSIDNGGTATPISSSMNGGQRPQQHQQKVKRTKKASSWARSAMQDDLW